MSENTTIKAKKVFGDYIIGEWFCPQCKYHIFPRTLNSIQNNFVWTQATKEGYLHPCCPKCATTLQYDDAT